MSAKRKALLLPEMDCLRVRDITQMYVGLSYATSVCNVYHMVLGVVVQRSYEFTVCCHIADVFTHELEINLAIHQVSG